MTAVGQCHLTATSKSGGVHSARGLSEHVQAQPDLNSGGHGDQQTEIARPNAFFALRLLERRGEGGREEVACIGYRSHHLIRAGAENVRQAVDKPR